MPRESVGPWFLTPDHLFVHGGGGAAVLLAGVSPDQPGARLCKKRWSGSAAGDLSARVGRGRRTSWANWRARSTAWPAASRRCWRRSAGCCSTFRTSCVRRWRGWAWPWSWRGSGDDLDAALDRIQKESDRLNALVGQLLQVTRAEGDPSSLRHNPVRLDELVQELVDDSKIEATARGCELRYEKREPATR